MNLYWLEQNEADVPVGNQWLSTRETCFLERMRIAKRRADWRLGRWTAKQAVAARLSLSTALDALPRIEITAMPCGAPEARLDGEPAEIAISLSHRAGTALCTVGPRQIDFGCDVEKVEPRSAAFIADYFTPSERALIEHCSEPERAVLLAMLWSAKESALKALREGLRADTRCVSVSLPSAEARGIASMVDNGSSLSLNPDNPDGWEMLRIRYSSDQVFAGWWRLKNHLVRTIVSTDSLPLPFPLRQATVCGYNHRRRFLEISDHAKV